ncbi:hypothetical protein LTR39_005011, partial [Cryomyces antarcticus]
NDTSAPNTCVSASGAATSVPKATAGPTTSTARTYSSSTCGACTAPPWPLSTASHAPDGVAAQPRHPSARSAAPPAAALRPPTRCPTRSSRPRPRVATAACAPPRRRAAASSATRRSAAPAAGTCAWSTWGATSKPTARLGRRASRAPSGASTTCWPRGWRRRGWWSGRAAGGGWGGGS